MPRDITQRHLKTFIEKYLNAIQVFNHSRLRLYLGQPIVNLCFQSSISEKREKTVSYRRVRSFALPLFSRTCVCTMHAYIRAETRGPHKLCRIRNSRGYALPKIYRQYT